MEPRNKLLRRISIQCKMSRDRLLASAFFLFFHSVNRLKKALGPTANRAWPSNLEHHTPSPLPYRG